MADDVCPGQDVGLDGLRIDVVKRRGRRVAQDDQRWVVGAVQIPASHSHQIELHSALHLVMERMTRRYDVAIAPVALHLCGMLDVGAEAPLDSADGARDCLLVVVGLGKSSMAAKGQLLSDCKPMRQHGRFFWTTRYAQHRLGRSRVVGASREDRSVHDGRLPGEVVLKYSMDRQVPDDGAALRACGEHLDERD